MKVLLVQIFLISLLSTIHAEQTENEAKATESFGPIDPKSLVPKKTTKRSAYGYGYGFSPYGYGDFYGYGYPYRSYVSYPYKIGYPYYGGYGGLYGGYGGYGYYGW